MTLLKRAKMNVAGGDFRRHGQSGRRQILARHLRGQIGGSLGLLVLSEERGFPTDFKIQLKRAPRKVVVHAGAGRCIRKRNCSHLGAIAGNCRMSQGAGGEEILLGLRNSQVAATGARDE